MKPKIGTIVVVEAEEYCIKQISMKAKDGSLKIVLEQVVPELSEAKNEHDVKLPFMVRDNQ